MSTFRESRRFGSVRKVDCSAAQGVLSRSDEGRPCCQDCSLISTISRWNGRTDRNRELPQVAGGMGQEPALANPVGFRTIQLGRVGISEQSPVFKAILVTEVGREPLASKG